MRILVTSDHHVGDQYSACPAKAVVTDEDQTRKIVLHPWQVYLNECWDYCRKNVGKVDIAILNGDSMEGEAQKSGGHGLTIQKMSDQVGAAVQHFGWIRECAKKVFVVKGTPYHEGHVAQAVEGFAEALGADKWPHTGLRTGTRFWYEAAGLTINASHHMTRGWIYPAGGADRTALFSLAASALGKLPRADIIIRSHNHLRRVLGVYDKDVIFTPAWKLVTPWAAKVMEETRAELYSDIGMILIEITPKKQVFVDWRSFSFKSFPMQVGREA